MFLRAELWWVWHAVVCWLSYHFAALPTADWILMFLYMFGNFAFVHWIRSQEDNKTQAFFCMCLALMPIIMVNGAAYLLLSNLIYAEALIVLLQLSSSVFYPIASLMPDTKIGDYHLYLWICAIILSLQSLIMIGSILLMRKMNDPQNSYVEIEEQE